MIAQIANVLAHLLFPAIAVSMSGYVLHATLTGKAD